MPPPDGKPARIMVVTAHPVDAFDNTGGTCAEHISLGDQVSAVICTSGIYTHNERLHDELHEPEAERDPAILGESAEAYAERKRTEATQSLGCFGIADVVVLPYDDGQYEINPEMVADLERLICDRRPHVMLMQDPPDGAAVRDDHAVVRVTPPLCGTLPVNRKRYEDLQLSSAERFRPNHQLLGAFVPEADGRHAWGFDPEARKEDAK